MIGTPALANLVASTPVGLTPEGFIYLGCGAYRYAYLGPDGVVYKREDSSDGCNVNEAETFAKYGSQVFEGFRLAACHLHAADILAMEYVKDNYDSMIDHPAADRMARWARDTLAYFDCPAWGRGKNWFIMDEVIVLTDYQDYTNGW